MKDDDNRLAINKILLVCAVVAPVCTVGSYIATYVSTMSRLDNQVATLEKTIIVSVDRLTKAMEAISANDQSQNIKFVEMNSRISNIVEMHNQNVKRQLDFDSSLLQWLQTGNRNRPMISPSIVPLPNMRQDG